MANLSLLDKIPNNHLNKIEKFSHSLIESFQIEHTKAKTMLPREFIVAWMFVFLVIFPNIFNPCTCQLEPRWAAKKRHVMREKVRKM